MGDPGPGHEPVPGVFGQAPHMVEVMVDQLTVALDNLAVDQDRVHQHRMAGLHHRPDRVVEGLHPPGIGAHENDVGGLPRGQGADFVAQPGAASPP